MATCSTRFTVRHSVSTKYISSLNKGLRKKHRSVIAGTPFRWFLDLNDNIKLGRKILTELVPKWVDSSGGFIIAEKLVAMNEKDFSLGLELSLDGKNIDLKGEMRRSTCFKYIGNGNRRIHLNLVYKCLMKKAKTIPCSSFCSLYILVEISEILIPKCSGRVFPILFEIVDNLNDLAKYCWGSIVYRFLVHGLNKASDALKEGHAKTKVHVNGCVYMLQVWLCENLIPPKVGIEKNPRILHWMNIHLGDNLVKGVLETGVVNEDVDIDFGTLKEESVGKDERRQINKDDKSSAKKELKRKRRESFMQTVHHQQSLVAELKRRVVVLEEEVAFEKARQTRAQDGGQSVPHEEPSISPRVFSSGGITPGGISSGGMSHQKGMSSGPPPMKTYVRMGSRKRYKARALRTPYVELLRIKNE